MNNVLFFVSQLVWLIAFVYLIYVKSSKKLTPYTTLSAVSAYFPDSIESKSDLTASLDLMSDYDIYAYQRARESGETLNKIQLSTQTEASIDRTKTSVAFKDSGNKFLGISFTQRVLSLVTKTKYIVYKTIKCVAIYNTKELFIGSFLQEDASTSPNGDINEWFNELKSNYLNVILLGHSRDGHRKIKAAVNTLKIQMIPLSELEHTDLVGPDCRDYIISNGIIPNYSTTPLYKNMNGGTSLGVEARTLKVQNIYRANVVF